MRYSIYTKPEHDTQYGLCKSYPENMSKEAHDEFYFIDKEYPNQRPRLIRETDMGKRDQRQPCMITGLWLD